MKFFIVSGGSYDVSCHAHVTFNGIVQRELTFLLIAAL